MRLDTFQAGEVIVRFGISQTSLLGTIKVITPISQITFYIILADILFLFCLRDINRLRVKFDNLDNVFIQGKLRTPIVRAYGHPWMLLDLLKSLIYTS